jgi:ATP-dependent Clp protease ATP-binding subunit ClpA
MSTPETVQQLAHDAVTSADPESALRAMSALRHELDALEPELVARALRAGASWSQVARALGVSKQAAHRKHRHLAEKVSPPTGAEPKVLVTSEARRSVQLAREEARGLGQSTVGTEHLLLGILRCRQSHAAHALASLGVTLDRAKSCLHVTIGEATGPASGPARKGRGAWATDGISRQARRILEGSLRQALKRGDGYIGVEHLLLALLADSRNGAMQTLEALHITPAQIRRQLDQEWAAITAGHTLEAEPVPSAASQ